MHRRTRVTADGIDAMQHAISARIGALYARHYGHDRTTATTYINGAVVLCLLEDILSADEDTLLDAGGRDAVLDGRAAFQVGMEDEFTVEVERLTGRRVTAFLSANQTAPGVAAELFMLDAPPEATR